MDLYTFVATLVVYRALWLADTLLHSTWERTRCATYPVLQYSLAKERVQHIIAYPISKGRLVNLAMFECNFDQENTEYVGPWVTKADPVDVAKKFEGWEPEVAEIMDVRPVYSSRDEA